MATTRRRRSGPTDDTRTLVQGPVAPGPPMPGAPLEEPPPDRDLWPWLLVLLGPKGAVVAQSPKPGTTRKRGDHMLVTVSLGPKPTQTAAAQPMVPDVTGEDQATAQKDLQAAGFTVRVVEQDTADESQDGIVLEQDPPPGQSAEAKSTVTSPRRPARYGTGNANTLVSCLATTFPRRPPSRSASSSSS